MGQKIRILLDGSTAEEYEDPIDLIIHTKCPGKWKVIDMETGEEYIGSPEGHPKFATMLMNRVSRGIIGHWSKLKWKING